MRERGVQPNFKIWRCKMWVWPQQSGIISFCLLQFQFYTQDYPKTLIHYVTKPNKGLKLSILDWSYNVVGGSPPPYHHLKVCFLCLNVLDTWEGLIEHSSLSLGESISNFKYLNYKYTKIFISNSPWSFLVLFKTFVHKWLFSSLSNMNLLS